MGEYVDGDPRTRLPTAMASVTNKTAPPANSPAPRFRIPVTPWHLVLLGVAVAIMFGVWAYMGYRAFRSSLLDATDRQGRALLESLMQSAEITAQANQFMRLQQIQNLADEARLASISISFSSATKSDLQEIIWEHDLDGVLLVSPTDEILAEPDFLAGFIGAQQEEITAAYENIRRGFTPWETLYHTDEATGEEWIGAFVQGNASGEICSVWRKTTRIEEVLNEIGIGHLIQQVGQKAGIDYILLQTPDGILFASRPVKPVLRIANDPFLIETIAENTTRTRELTFEGQQVWEAARPFLSAHVPNGILRVGLSLRALREATSQFGNQLLVSTVFLGLLTVVIAGLVLARQSLQTVRRSYAQIQTLTGQVLDAMDSAVVAIDASNRITHFNPAAEQLFTIPAAAALGSAVEKIFPDDEVHLKQVATGQEQSFNSDWTRQAGEVEQQLSVSTAPIKTAEETTSGAVAVIVDQTESRRLAERIRRAERLSEMGNMAAGVAHEIRNPLNAIALAAQRLAMEFTVAEDAEEFNRMTTSIVKETRRLDTIINEFLDLAHPPREQPQSFTLGRVVEEVAALLVHEAQSKDIQLDVQSADDIHVYGVPAELKKALINILGNAIAFTPPQGKVTLNAQLDYDSQTVLIAITDTGPGISPDEQKKIFQPYYTTREHGTGLGLAITARIVADFAGSIDVQSTPDAGTTFLIRLPLHHGKESQTG